MSAASKVGQYFLNIYESVTTILMGMWITFKTALFEGKITIQYPSFDVTEGRRTDEVLFPEGFKDPPFEPLMGANQDYRGPLKKSLSDRYRGFLGYVEPNCTVCNECIRICPIDVIHVEGVKIEGRKGKAPIIFSVDFGKCIYCGLCVEACKFDALHFTREFEGASFDWRDMIREFVSEEHREEVLRLAAEYRLKREAAKAEKKRASGAGEIAWEIKEAK